jgi:hypothetical protein
MDGSATCRHETRPSQWRLFGMKSHTGGNGLLPICHPANCSAFSLRGETPDPGRKSRIFNNLKYTIHPNSRYLPRRPILLTGDTRLSSLWNEPGL